MGTALKINCVESGLLLAGHARSDQSLHQRDGKMNEVEVELRVEGGREKFWFSEKRGQTQHRQDEENAPPDEVVV